MVEDIEDYQKEHICFEYLGNRISTLFENGFLCNFIYDKNDELERQEILNKEQTYELYLTMVGYYGKKSN